MKANLRPTTNGMGGAVRSIRISRTPAGRSKMYGMEIDLQVKATVLSIHLLDGTSLVEK